MNSFKYIGCFFDREQVMRLAEKQRPERLFRPIVYPHVTFAYRPAEVPTALFGRRVTLQVVGYACDGKNEAFAVAFDRLPPELMPLAGAIACPHITLSVAADAEPVDSGRLTFQPIAPFTLEGVFGGIDRAGRLHT